VTVSARAVVALHMTTLANTEAQKAFAVRWVMMVLLLGG
jgi:hypothetical protein